MRSMATPTTTSTPTTIEEAVTTTVTITTEVWHGNCRLSPGASAGIGIASLFLICATIITIVWLFFRRGYRKHSNCLGRGGASSEGAMI